MDSDVDTHDESDYEVGYPCDDDDDNIYPTSDDDNNSVNDCYDDDGDDDSENRMQEDYIVLSEEDIRAKQEETLMRVCSVLSVSRVSAITLLLHYNWSASDVEEAWFSDEHKVRTTLGLLDQPVVECTSHDDSKIVKCRICFDDYSQPQMFAAACGHLFCGLCWKSYISISISDGPGCLILRCPDPKCRVVVGQDMVNVLVSEEDSDKYAHYLVRSYVECGRRKIKWCPAPGCEYAVEFESGGGDGYDVSCKCMNSFCWKCSAEAHRPVDCDTVGKWELKNSAESENVTWILANSKSCPKCKRPIEKNDGCMHMTCTPPCKFEFCWLCLGAWKDHGASTGGFYACNSYAKAKKEGKFKEEEKRRERAKNALEKYTHYYERWAANQKSRTKAMADLKELQTNRIENVKENCVPLSQLSFIAEAWQQIIECRRVLRWTYAYGYYILEQDRAKAQLFEYLQGQAESGLERLHQCAEQELKVHIDANYSSDDFPEFKEKLAGLTSVTRNYFENLVTALERGLPDVADKVPEAEQIKTREGKKNRKR